MELKEYVVTVRHDGGKFRLTVKSSAGISGAKALVMSAEGCPKCAIENVELKTGKGMKITDLDGREIGVTDLNKAIEQADLFRGAHHLPPVPSDLQRQAYWSDVYQKLIELKKYQEDERK